MRRIIFILLCCSFLCLKAFPLQAQTAAPSVKSGTDTNAQPSPRPSSTPPAQDEEIDEGDIVRVETTLVTVPVSVRDRDGRYVANLHREDFRIYEEGAEQELTHFSPVETPFTVALLIDISSSKYFLNLADVVKAANVFVDQLRPEDHIIVVTVDGEVHELVKETSVRRIWHSGIRIAPNTKGTKLFDAMNFIINERFKGQKTRRKAIVLFTDGEDTNSVFKSKHNLHDVEASNILVYPIRFPISAAGNSARAMRADHYLKDLVKVTGAQIYQAGRLEDLTLAFASIAKELSQQYSLGYYPRTQAAEGQRRRIKVRVNSSKLVVHARDSYLTNASGTRQPK